MKVESKGPGLIRVEGRIDSSGAAEFEKEMLSRLSGEPAEIDFTDVDYISSAGLRVLLKLLKEKYDFIITGASAEVYEIFQMTGFSNLLKVRRSLKDFDPAECELIGSGVTGDVYQVDSDTIVKVYKDFITYDMAARELSSSREAFIRGIPTAIPFDIMKCKGCLAVRYELMNGKTLGQAITMEPDRLDEFAGKYAALVKNNRLIKLNPKLFEDITVNIRKYLDNLKTWLSEEDFELISDLIKCIPAGEAFVHGDAHPGNIMVQDGELLLIDMADVSIGWAGYDLTQIYNALVYSAHSSMLGEVVRNTLGLSIENIDKLWHSFISHYFETTDPEIINEKTIEIALANGPVFVARVGVLPPEMRQPLLAETKENYIDPFIRPNRDRIKEIYRKGIS